MKLMNQRGGGQIPQHTTKQFISPYILSYKGGPQLNQILYSKQLEKY